ncbi:MAG: phosphate signaling complex protein PhoU [Ignavibacteria bacterium]
MLQWQREIEKLKNSILSLSSLVEEQITKAMLALERRDIDLAKQTIKKDEEIDNMEILIEEECLKILALYQPVADELRFIVSALKMNNDLERIGDLAANIAKRAAFLSKREKLLIVDDLKEISVKARSMVTKSLDALINKDVELARQVLISDDEVDKLNKGILKKLLVEIKLNPERAKEYFSIQSVSKSLERIADSATNIAEDVVYMCTGQIIRHQGNEFTGEETN